MTPKRPSTGALLAIAAVVSCVAGPSLSAVIEEVATSSRRWTGVAVSKSGRVFVNFPRWSPDVPVSVAEIDSGGAITPYPDETLNGWSWGEDPSGKFVCVQSVYVDHDDRLWILDPANPMFAGVVAGGAKLIEVGRAGLHEAQGGVGVVVDGRQRLVDLVGDCRGQLADCSHTRNMRKSLLQVQHLLSGLPLLRDIARNSYKLVDFAKPIPDR